MLADVFQVTRHNASGGEGMGNMSFVSCTLDLSKLYVYLQAVFP